MAKGHRWSTIAGEGGVIPVILKRRIVPTGEPDNTERVPSGSVGGWGKRSVSYLARSLPNLRSRFRARLTPSVRQQVGDAYGIGGVQRMWGSSRGFGSDLPEVWDQLPQRCNWQVGYHAVFCNDRRDVCGSGYR